MKKTIALFLALVSLLAVFVPTGVVAEEKQEYAYGDLNFDKAIDAVDALMVLQNAVGKLELNEIQATAANVNGSENIDAADALLILQFSVQKVTQFPLGLTFTVGGGQEEPPAPLPDDDGYTISYDTSNSYNGAYAEDTTADCSFIMDNTGLAANTIYVVGSTAVSDVDVKRLVVSLQGLVNRDFGRDDDHTTLISLTSDISDSSWLGEMTKSGICKDFARIPVNTKERFYELFENQLKYCGMVVWDPDVWATANVAATICGLDGYLPVMDTSWVEYDLEQMGVETKMNLVDKFTGKGTIPDTSLESTGSAKNDAYRWALEKYFNRCSSKYIAYTLDGAVTVNGSGWTNSTNCLINHDYLIARRCFFFDLDPYTGEAACDDPDQPVGLDAETMRLIFQKRYDRANGEIGMAMGFPPWWAKYTQEHGGATLPSLSLEPYYTEVVTCYNMAMEADAAQPAEMTNGSVYYKYIPEDINYQNNKPAEKLTYDDDTYYFTIYVGDYDSSAWMKKYVHSMWLQRGGDKKRGQLPLMWSYNPNLSYRIPLIYDYVYKNATENDYFAAGDSGAGYVNPSAFYPDITLSSLKTTRPASTGNGADKWVSYCKEFYELFDIEITGFIINTGNRFDEKIMAMYNQFAPVGSTYYNGNDDRLLIYDGVPYIQCRIGVRKGDPNYLYDWAVNGMRGYHFAAYRTVSWTPTEIYDNVNAYVEYAADKGLTVKYVDPYNFFDLIRQSGQGVKYGE